MRNIVFYSESAIYGGHEKMAVAAHTAIRTHIAGIQICWIVNSQNHTLMDVLMKAGIDYTTLVEAPAFSLLSNPFRAVRKILSNAARLRTLSPDLVMLVQGSIVGSYDGIFSAKIGKFPCCSYIPMAFRISDYKQQRIPSLANLLWSFLYRTILSYITIDSEMAERLRRNNRKASIFVVDNYVPKGESLCIRQPTLASLGIPPGRKVLAVIGRIAFHHKCQDWIVRELNNDSFLKDKYVLFVGDGSDAPALQAMLVPEVRDRFGLIGWKKDLREVYAATDVLVIPSKVEGVPLVMLEALGYGIPVVGTDQDGMRSWLPKQWRFSRGDTVGLKRGIEAALAAASPGVWDGIAERLVQVHDEGRFAAQFAHALIQACER
jgi:glycosyltransferase involved in cell wall biosynthesis